MTKRQERSQRRENRSRREVGAGNGSVGRWVIKRYHIRVEAGRQMN
jgi:hypothetical protein